MSAPRLVLPPDGRFAVERRPDGWVIALTPHEAIVRVGDVAIALLAAGAMVATSVVLLTHSPGARVVGTRPPDVAVPLLVVSVFVLLWAMFRIGQDFVWATIHIGGAQLRIEITWLGWTRHHAWECKRLQAIGAWEGLHIAAGPDRSACLFAWWDLNGLYWVAQTLRVLLELPEHLPTALDEIAVSYTGTFWDRPVAGVLRAGDKELISRHPLVAQPHLIFRPETNRRRARVREPVLPLSSTDIACRLQADEAAQLTIAPDGVQGAIQGGGVPCIYVSILGPLLHNKILLRPGCVLKRQLAAADREFQMTFWCDDAEALQQALARFWGVRAEDERP